LERLQQSVQSNLRLEGQGLDRDEYQLQRVIDVEALERLINATGPQIDTDLEIRFSVGEFRMVVTPSDVAVLKTS